MPLGTFIAGQYTGSYAAAALGMTQNGWKLTQNTKAQLMNETDAFGESVIDWVWRGGDTFCDVTFREWKTSTKSTFVPYAAIGILSNAAAPIGRLASDIAAALVLTALANTPAAVAADPATLTSSKALLAPNFDVNFIFDSRFRDLPIRFQFLPYVSTNNIWFSVT